MLRSPAVGSIWTDGHPCVLARARLPPRCHQPATLHVEVLRQNLPARQRTPPMGTLPQGHPSSVAKTFWELHCHLRLSLPASPEASPARALKVLTPFSSFRSSCITGVSPNPSPSNPILSHFLVDLKQHTWHSRKMPFPGTPFPEWCPPLGSSADKCQAQTHADREGVFDSECPFVPKTKAEMSLTHQLISSSS